MATTSRLVITEMVVGQSGGENLFNTALRTLDANVNLTAITQTNQEAGGETGGEVYLVTNGGTTSEFSGKDNQIAYYDNGFKFIVADEGMICYLQDEDLYFTFNGSTWEPFSTPKLVVVPKTANFNIETTDNGTLFTNTGAGGAIEGTLPAATVGLQYYFACGAAQSLRAGPDGSETISNAAGTPATGGAGKYLGSAGVIGETLHIVCAVAGTWNVVGNVGVWTLEA